MRKGSDPKSFHLAWNNIDGNIRFRRLKESLDFLKTHPTAPEEASWFYVHEMTFQNITARDHASHNEVLSGNLLSNLIYNKPNGLTSIAWNDSEEFTSVVDGVEIKRNKLDLSVTPLSDLWQKSFPSFEPQRNFGNSSQMALKNIIDFYPPMSKIGFGGSDILDVGTYGYKPPYGPTVNLSSINYPFILNRDLNLGHSVGSINTTVDAPTTIGESSGIGIPYKLNRGINLLNYMNPQHNDYSSGREEEEYQKTSGDYAKKLKQNEQVNVIMDIAQAIANPIHHAGMFFRMFKQLGDVYLSYKDEQAREADAMLNYFGTELHSVNVKVNKPTGSNYYSYNMKTGETLSLTIPTKQIYFTENNEKVEYQEIKTVTVPVNRLFKSYEEFVTELELDKYSPPFASEFETIKDIKITPYMENEVFEKILYKENQFMSGK